MKKFVIIKKAGHYKHIKGYGSHEAITYDNGFNYYTDVIETGIIDNGNIFFIECRNKKHLAKREYNRGLFDPGIIRTRATETYYAYNLSQFKEGD